MASVAQDPIYQTIFKIQYFVLQPHFTGPLFVRIAFHDAATWNRNSTTNKGGCAPSCYTPLYRLLAFLTSKLCLSLCHKRTFLLVPSAYMRVCAVLCKFFHSDDAVRQRQRVSSLRVRLALQRRPAALCKPAGLGACWIPYHDSEHKGSLGERCQKVPLGAMHASSMPHTRVPGEEALLPESHRPQNHRAVLGRLNLKI